MADLIYHSVTGHIRKCPGLAVGRAKACGLPITGDACGREVGGELRLVGVQ
jgi:hypothetical protein